jgi:hypothetical protein
LLALGAPIEKENGSLRTLFGYLTVAFASSIAEQALFTGGVGLSGVGYGAFAYGYVRARSETTWAEIVDARTTQTFVGWFFFCIAATMANEWLIANVAHAVGALTGGLLALARERRWALGATLAVIAIAIVLDLRPVRERVNLSGAPAYEAETRGLALLESGDVRGAVREIARATSLSPRDARVRLNLGIALSRAGRARESCAEFRKSYALGLRGEDVEQAIEWCDTL